MFKKKNRYRYLIFFTLFFVSAGTLAQKNDFNIEAYTYGGREHNIFKSPERLYDRTLMDYLDKNELIVSDYFADMGYDIEFQREKRRKYNFEIATDFWHRRFYNYPNINQNSLSFNILYEFFLGKKTLIGTEYNLSRIDKIGTSISGDDLVRSFKYLGNKMDVYLQIMPNKKLEMELLGNFEYKYYYNVNTDMPLNHTNIDANYDFEYEVNKSNTIAFGLGFTDRRYQYYAAANANGYKELDYDDKGVLIDGYPLRHFRYYDFGVEYDLRPFKSLLINPGFDFTRREDLYEDYYSYTSFSSDIRLRYWKDRIYASLSVDYRQVNYDLRYAYTYIANTSLLTYKFIDYNAEIRYELSNSIEIRAELATDNRDTNTLLEHARTRRPYYNYEILFGINIELVD